MVHLDEGQGIGMNPYHTYGVMIFLRAYDDLPQVAILFYCRKPTAILAMNDHTIEKKSV